MNASAANIITDTVGAIFIAGLVVGAIVVIAVVAIWFAGKNVGED